MGLGVLLGLALLATMRPGQLGGSSALPPQRTVARDLTVVRPAPPPAPPKPERAPRAAPAEVAPAEGHPVEVADTGEAPQQAMVVVDVVDHEGRPTDGAIVYPVDCPGFQRARRGAYVAEPGSCTLRAFRRDGALFARGPAATVELTPGDIGYLQLELRTERTGGIGVRFQPEPGGMRVVDVVEGTPAWEAGLEAGDLIVAVGDEPVGGLNAEAFVDRMTGPEGTEVDFTISYSTDDGEAEESVRVTRQYLDG